MNDLLTVAVVNAPILPSFSFAIIPPSLSMKKPLSRRHFLATTAAAGTFMIVPRHVLGGPGHTPPSETITQGTIGVGGQAYRAHVVANKPGAPTIQLALCDVDSEHLAHGMQKAGAGCTGYKDFRELLDRQDIDVVRIGTPDHWHALLCIYAAQAGKDVFCEKPMTRFIREGQAVIDAVKQYGRVAQFNTYGRESIGRERWADYKKLVDSGLLGTPITAYLSTETDNPFKVAEWSGRTDLTPQPVPKQLDYDMWLGPAPYKPYNEARIHQKYRGYWDYAGGGLSDMGQHWLDPIQYILGKDGTGPVKIEATAPFPAHPEATGLWGRITMTYDDGTRIVLDSCDWGDFPKGPQPFLSGPKGKIIHGKKKAQKRAEPADLWEKVAKLPDPPKLISFEESVKTRAMQNSIKPNAEQAHRSVSLLHLSNIAIRTGRTIHWDPVKQQVIGDEEANRLVNVPMRAPWQLPS